MTGPPPKPPEHRRNRSAKRFGEFVDLPPATTDPAPPMPHPAPNYPWSERTRAAWSAWWSDPVAAMWTPADYESLSQLVQLTEYMNHGDVRLAPEVRLRMDGLGLTLKGKRDLRWRVVAPDAPSFAEDRAPELPGRYDHLRVIVTDDRPARRARRQSYFVVCGT